MTIPLSDVAGDTIGLNLVRRLLAVHFPYWAELPITEFQPAGTQNTVFRLADDLSVRFPRTRQAAIRLERELRWLPIIGGRGTFLEIPTPVAMVGPTPDFGMPWAVYRWIEGECFTLTRSLDNRQAARRLARFLTVLRGIDPAAAPLSERSRSLIARDQDVRRAIGLLSNIIDAERATASWERSLSAPTRPGPMVWTHGDLLSTNLLLRRGRLTAVIDFGYAGIGDPAIDLMPAWSTLDAEGRDVFRRALDVDDSTWLRARGFALHQAVGIAAKHLRTGGPMLAVAVHMAEAILSDS